MQTKLTQFFKKNTLDKTSTVLNKNDIIINTNLNQKKILLFILTVLVKIMVKKMPLRV